jgi:hypothetical protein
MKRIAALFCLFCLAAATVNAGQIIPKVGVDLPGSFEFSSSGLSLKGDVDTGFSFGAEYLGPVDERLSWGGGFEYQLGRKLSKFSGVDISSLDLQFSYLPVYLTLKYLLSRPSMPAVPFLKANLGYNVVYDVNDNFKNELIGDASRTGGLYWALGAGVMVSRNVDLEVLYSSYAGSVSRGGTTVDTPYTKFGVLAGYAFDLK